MSTNTLIAGQITSDGTITSAFMQQGDSVTDLVASDLSVDQDNTGRYTIDWSGLEFSYSQDPAVVLTIVTTSGSGFRNTATLKSISGTEAGIAIKDNSGDYTNQPFSFIVTGLTD